eukprot:3029137-Prymnesium_polylepis.1
MAVANVVTARVNVERLKQNLIEARANESRRGSCKEQLGAWCNALIGTFRSDHTIVSFVAPPEEDGALTEMQTVQVRARIAAPFTAPAGTTW